MKKALKKLLIIAAIFALLVEFIVIPTSIDPPLPPPNGSITINITR